MKNYYQIFGLPTSASDDEIKKIYRKLALKFHPDKNNNDEYFEERFKELQEGYEILSDPAKRKKYDLGLNIIQPNAVYEAPPPKKPSSQSQASGKQQTTTKTEDGGSPATIAEAVENLYRTIKYLEDRKVNRKLLVEALDILIGEKIANLLIKHADYQSNQRIVEGALGMLRFLNREELKKFVPLLVKIAGTNNDLCAAIYKKQKQVEYEILNDKIQRGLIWVAILGVIGIVIYAVYFSDDEANRPTTWTPPKEDPIVDFEPLEKVSRFSGNQLHTGDSPYNDYFGKPLVQKKFLNSLKVMNRQDLDAIVCLTNSLTGRTIRNEYLKAGDSFTMQNVPNGTYYLKTFGGKNWNPDSLLFDGKLRGWFDTDAYFMTSDEPSDMIRMDQYDDGDKINYSTYTITLYPVTGGNMESRKINPEDFFKRH